MKNCKNSLPRHGRVNCTKCFGDQMVEFDKTRIGTNNWRITANPLAWGNPEAEIVVLGFSKGPTQLGAVATAPHDEIAYKGQRTNVAKIFRSIGLLPTNQPADSKTISNLISSKTGRFHFGSLIRCTVEQLDSKREEWIGSGGGMLDKFMKTDFGETVSHNCATQHLANLPSSTKLVVMFGLGQQLNYVESAFKLFQQVRPGTWRKLNGVSYTDGKIVVTHVEHFASQGKLLPQWLGEIEGKRVQHMQWSKGAVSVAFGERVATVNQETTNNLPVTTMPNTSNESNKIQSLKPAINSSEKFDEELVTRLLLKNEYSIISDNAKLLGAKASNGESLYILKLQTKLNKAFLFVNPKFARECLYQISGVEEVSQSHQFHSNMSTFPKKLNKGKTETTFGWQVRISTQDHFDQFLKEFRNTAAFDAFDA